LLAESDVELLTTKGFGSYDEHYQALQASRDQNSSTEDKFLKHLYAQGLRLPDKAQPDVPDMYVKPDFFYKPNVMVFCDGTPHDDETVKRSDYEKRKALRDEGFQVLSWYYGDNLANWIAQRPDIFTKAK
jgi:very-short-patch-repair endonuclease